MKKLLVVLLAVVAAGAAYYAYGRGGAAPLTWRTAPLTRGSVVETVSTTGTLRAVNTVLVGTQVTGVIDEILVDFNDRVTRGQVVARLETDVLEARLAQDEASFAAAEAAVEGGRVALEEAQAKRARAEGLVAQRLATSEALETAQFGVRAAEASLRAAETRVVQAAAAVRMARTSLQYATITSPIDGVVLDRAVAVGQTVAASLQAPTLFTIAEDLRQMRVEAAVDEADIGRIHTGQRVTFTVDAYPERRFRGRVSQRRLGPIVTANVVTYQVIVETENEDEALLPGMTASVSVEVARKDDTLVVPATALRYTPPGVSAPPGEGGRGGGRPGSGGGEGGGGGGRPGAGGGGGGGGERARRPSQVWVLDGQGEAAAPRAIPVTPGPSDGADVAIEPVEAGALAEGALVLVGQEGGDERSGPVNPMSLLRGGSGGPGGGRR